MFISYNADPSYKPLKVTKSSHILSTINQFSEISLSEKYFSNIGQNTFFHTYFFFNFSFEQFFKIFSYFSNIQILEN